MSSAATAIASACPIVAFTDLDDTLFSSMPKHPSSFGLEPASWLVNGSPVSYTCPRQRALIGWLRHCAHVVPVTARNASAFARVGMAFTSYVILNHGGTVLLPGGAEDAGWTDMLAPLRERASAVLEVAAARFENDALNVDHALNVRVIGDDRGPFYLMVKHKGGDAAIIDELARGAASAWLAEHEGFALHVNANNLAILPPGISKAAAVMHVQRHLQAELGNFMSIGLGDSLTDAPFMLACDFSLVPGRSQLSQVLRGIAS